MPTGTPMLSVLRFRPEARRNPGLAASCLMSIRYSVRYVLQGRYQGLSLFDAAFDLTWLTCLSCENGHLPGTLRSPVQITFAQRHADAGVPIDVLAELLDHRNLNVTRCYYRVGEDRRREAVDKVTAMSFDRHGNRTWRDARALLESEHARYAIGEVAVPYGTCTEPANVQAGGDACPVRFRCAGCDHFRTDVSYLPDLTGYLDDLLRTRERLAAAIDGVDEWARAAATPAQEEITRIRRLITRIKGDIAQLTDAEHAQVDEAVTVIRKHRAVSLGMPAVRASTPAREAIP